MKKTPLVALLALLPTMAHAHTGHHLSQGGFGWGIAHPFSGADHLLAMFAVGLWAAQLGGRAKAVLPASFLSAMAAGAALGREGLLLPFVEPGVLAGAVLVGALLTLAKPLPSAVAALVTGGVAIFHGQAHGLEMPVGAGGLETAAGFLFGSGMLLLAGLLTGLALKSQTQRSALRVAGAAVVYFALALALL